MAKELPDGYRVQSWQAGYTPEYWRDSGGWSAFIEVESAAEHGPRVQTCKTWKATAALCWDDHDFGGERVAIYSWEEKLLWRRVTSGRGTH